MRSRHETGVKPPSVRRGHGGAGALLPVLLAVLACGRGGDVGSRVRRLEIDAAATTIVDGLDTALTVTATEGDGDRRDVTALVEWSSSAPAIATVVALADGSRLARGHAAGAATLTARHAPTGVSTTFLLTITPAELVALELTPTTVSIAAGTSQPFVATGIWTDATTSDLTATVTWQSDAPAVATMDGAPGFAGIARSLTPGSATVTATAGDGTQGSATLTVTAATLVALELTPVSATLPLGTTQAFVATGYFSDGTTQDLTDSVDWSSSAPAIATIDPSPPDAGLASAVAVGSTTIAALHVDSGQGDSAALDVTAAVLQSLAVSPTLPSVPLGVDQSFVATGTYSDGTTQDLTALVDWSSSDEAIATIADAPGAAGLATPLAIGTTTIGATVAGGGPSDATTLTVTAATLASLAIAPLDPSVPLGFEQAFTATGTYSDGSTADLTEQVTWSSSDDGVATISNAGGSEGLASAQALGATTITATDPGSAIADSTALTVSAATLLSIAVTPADVSVAIGATLDLTATGTYSDSSTADLTTQVTWSSDATAIATVSNAGGSEGVATGVALGGATVTATEPGSGVAGQTSLTVTGDIAFVGAAGASASSGNSSLAIATPAGVAEGDFLVAGVAIRPASATITPPAGWTLLRRSDSSGGAANSLAVYTRVATAGEPADHTFTFSTATGSAGGITAFRGVHATTPIDVESAQSTASGLNHATPSVDTTVADTMVVTFHSMSSSATWAPPAGQTESVDVASAPPPAATGICLTATHALQAAVGATGSKSATASNDADTGNAAIVVLRKPQ